MFRTKIEVRKIEAGPALQVDWKNRSRRRWPTGKSSGHRDHHPGSDEASVIAIERLPQSLTICRAFEYARAAKSSSSLVSGVCCPRCPLAALPENPFAGKLIFTDLY
jgi:hypothetical protein